MPISRLPGLTLSSTTMSILEAADAAGQLTLFNSVEELVAAAAPPEECSADGFYTVGYDVADRGFVPEAKVCRATNGIAANYLDAYMRRRDPECMVIADDQNTDKPTFSKRFGQEFDGLRN